MFVHKMPIVAYLLLLATGVVAQGANDAEFLQSLQTKCAFEFQAAAPTTLANAHLSLSNYLRFKPSHRLSPVCEQEFFDQLTKQMGGDESLTLLQGCPEELASRSFLDHATLQKLGSCGWSLNSGSAHCDMGLINAECSTGLLAVYVAQSRNYELDKELVHACDSDVVARCSASEDGQGAIQLCLKDEFTELTPACGGAMFKRALLSLNHDIRAHAYLLEECAVPLDALCLSDRAHLMGDEFFCIDKLHRKDKGVTPTCWDAVSRERQFRLNDVRMQANIFPSCDDDFATLCPTQASSTNSDPIVPWLGQGFSCLVDNVTKIKAQECRTAVEVLFRHTMNTEFFFSVVSTTCEKEMAQRCAKIPKARRCIVQMFAFKTPPEDMSEECKRSLHWLETLMSTDANLDTEFLNTCAKELNDPSCNDQPYGTRFRCVQSQVGNGKVSDDCVKLLVRRQARYAHNLKLYQPMFRACKAERKTCEKEATDNSNASSTLRCLMDKYQDIENEACKKFVMADLGVAALNVESIDVEHNCAPDIAKYCPYREPSDITADHVNVCLEHHLNNLSAKCAADMHHILSWGSLSIKLNPLVRNACKPEESALCGVAHRSYHGVMSCFEQNIDNPEMSKGCRAAVIEFQERISVDVKLDLPLYHACKATIDAACSNVPSDAVESCLVTQLVQGGITDAACKEQVVKTQKLRANVAEVAQDFIDACESDAQLLCSNVKDTHGNMHVCLQDNLGKLSKPCAAHEQRLMRLGGRDIRFNTHLADACKDELASKCGHAKGPLITCLKKHQLVSGEEFNEECRLAMHRQYTLESFDPLINAPLRMSCADMLPKYCSKYLAPGTSSASISTSMSWEISSFDDAPGAPAVHDNSALIDCLTDHRFEISRENHACTNEIFYTMLATSRHWRNDYNTSKVCAEDVEFFCGSELKQKEDHLAPVLACLRRPQVMVGLSPACAARQHQLMFREAGELKLKPKIGYNCAVAVQLFCANEPDAYNCLVRNRNDPRMPLRCKSSLVKDEEMFNELNLSKICATDAHELCKYVPSEEDVRECLFENVSKMKSPECRSAVLKTVELTNENMKVDSTLITNCKSHLEACELKNAIDTPAGSEEGLHCLAGRLGGSNDDKLNPNCAKSVHIFVRASHSTAYKLKHKCPAFLKEHCKPELDVVNSFDAAATRGELSESVSKLGACFFHAMLDPEQSQTASRECKYFFHSDSVNHADSTGYHEVQESCEDDAERLCDEDLDVESWSDRYHLEQCLVEQFDAIVKPKCKRSVMQLQQIWSSFYDANFDIARYCTKDVRKFCSEAAENEPTNPGIVHQCLQAHVKALSPSCAKKELAQMRREAENLNLKPAVKRACVVEMKAVCRNEPDVLTCLEENLSHPAMGETCRATLGADVVHNRDHGWQVPGLVKHCKVESLRLCHETTSPKGDVPIECLISKLMVIKDGECQRRVRVVMDMRAGNIKTDTAASNSCASDIKQFCASIKSGQGRVHKCLQKNMKHLSKPCRKAERKMIQAQYFDEAVLPSLRKQCTNELDNECVRNKSLKCLIKKFRKDDSDFSQSCRDAVETVIKGEYSDASFNKAIFKMCKHQTQHGKCSTVPENESFKCLVEFAQATLGSGRDLPKDMKCANVVAAQLYRAFQYFLPEIDIIGSCAPAAATLCPGVGAAHTFSCLQSKFDQVAGASNGSNCIQMMNLASSSMPAQRPKGGKNTPSPRQAIQVTGLLALLSIGALLSIVLYVAYKVYDRYRLKSKGYQVITIAKD